MSNLLLVIWIIGEGDEKNVTVDIRGTRQKPPPNLKSQVTFSHAPARIRTQAMVRDSVQSVATP